MVRLEISRYSLYLWRISFAITTANSKPGDPIMVLKSVACNLQ
jgi:hypothetical protein